MNKEKSLYEMLKEKEPFSLSCHRDSDGLYSATILRRIFKIKEPIKIPPFNDYDTDVSVDLGFPSNKEWYGISIDHHPDHPEERKYTLFWDHCPTGLILYKHLKDYIKPEDYWLVVGSLCINGETKISTPSGSRPARTIKENDIILSWSGNGFDNTIVKKIHTRMTDEVYHLVFKYKKNKRNLYVTKEHPILTTDLKWIPVGELNIGDEVLFLDSGTYQRVTGANMKCSLTHKQKFKDEKYAEDKITRSLKGHTTLSILEERIVKISKEYLLPLKFVGNGDLMIGRFCPDFQVIGQPDKIIEVSRKHYKSDKHESLKLKYYKNRKYIPFILYLTRYLPDDNQIALMLRAFISNGYKLISKEIIHKAPKYSRGLKVYNFECSPYNNYIAQSLVLHNCGDGQPELVPDEIWDSCPELLEGRGILYQSQWKLGVSSNPLYVFLSSGINSLCRLGFPEAALKILDDIRNPHDLLENQEIKDAIEKMRKEESSIYASKPIVESYGNFSLVRIRTSLPQIHICGLLGAKLMGVNNNMTYIVLNEGTGEGSIRGNLAKYISNKMNKEGFKAGGHAKYCGFNISETKILQFLDFIRSIRL